MDFNKKRFKQLFVRDLRENKKTYLLFIGALFAVSVVAMLLMVVSAKMSLPTGVSEMEADDFYYWTESVHRSVIKTGGGLYMIFAIPTFLAAFVSITFACVNRRDKRFNYLLLPASHAEKFFSRIAITVGGGVLIAVLMILLSDAIGYLFQMLLIGKAYSFVYHLSKDLIQDFEWQLALITLPMWGLFNYSLYLAGSAFFRNYAFIKTFITYTIASMLFGIVLMVITAVWNNFLNWDDGATQLLMILISTFGTLFCWIYAYRSMKQTQLNSR